MFNIFKQIFRTSFLFLFILITNLACKTANNNTNHISLLGTLTYSTSVGYGNIYTCKIKEIKEGNLKSKTIHITILDKKYDDFINTHLDPKLIEIKFIKKEEHVPYQNMPINGFVDEQMTSYEIVSMN